MHKHSRIHSAGFTIVELLIVVVVIAILASISLVAYTGIQGRARDAVRANDIAQIKKALLLYDARYGGVVRPGVSGYTKPASEPGMAGWDVSTSASWLAFMRSSEGDMPVDPANVLPNTGTITGVGGNKIYSYYCYPAGHGSAYLYSPAAQLRYNTEAGVHVTEKFEITACLNQIPS